MEGALAQTHTGHVASRRAIDNVLHQPTTDTLILHGGIDGDRADADDRRALIQEVAADDCSVSLGNDAVKSWVFQQHAKQPHRGLHGGKLTREAMRIVDRTECVIADSAARGGVMGRGETQRIHKTKPPPAQRLIASYDNHAIRNEYREQVSGRAVQSPMKPFSSGVAIVVST